MEFTVNGSIPITFEKIEELADNRFTKVKIWLMHTGKNLNNSVFEKKVVEDALPSLANIPILGFIQVDSLNQTDFKGHEQRLVVEDDGIRIEYLGKAYGVIPESNNAKFEFKRGTDGVEREYLTVEGILWNKFKESIDIFERDGVKAQSMELAPHSIQGEFNKDGAFYFTKFQFEGACILGDSVTPAMKGSIIEKIDFSTYNASFQDMLSEFNAYYSEISQSNKVDLYKNNQEGGNGVNELLEVFSQYPTLTEEDVAEIKANLEQYSVETLKEKLDELVANKESSNTQVEDQFTARQLENEIRVVLSKEKFVDEWGYLSRAYWYIDHDENRVYAEDVTNSFVPVGMNYSKNGDFVVIDFSSKKRVKFVPQDMEGETDVSASFVSVERNEFEINKMKEDVTKEVSEQFAKVQSEFENVKELNKELQQKINSFENSDQSTEIENLKEQVSELTSYKLAREKQDKLDVIKKFTQLTDEEKQPFIDEIEKYSTEELEEKLFALVGKKGITSFSKQPKDYLKVSLVNYKSTDSNQPEWVQWVEQYKAKNN